MARVYSSRRRFSCKSGRIVQPKDLATQVALQVLVLNAYTHMKPHSSIHSTRQSSICWQYISGTAWFNSCRHISNQTSPSGEVQVTLNLTNLLTKEMLAAGLLQGKHNDTVTVFKPEEAKEKSSLSAAQAGSEIPNPILRPRDGNRRGEGDRKL